MRKPLMVAASMAVAAVSLAGCKLDVTPLPDDDVAPVTVVDGDGRTEFDVTKTRLGLYRSPGAVSNGDLAADACSWKLLGQTDSDTDLEVLAEGTTESAVDLDPAGGVGAPTDFNDEAEDQDFELKANAEVLEAEGCKDFVRVDA